MSVSSVLSCCLRCYLAAKPVTRRKVEVVTVQITFMLRFLSFVRSFFLSGTVVGALAHWTVAISPGVFFCDCGDLQVLQSSDLPLPAHRYVFKKIPEIIRSVRAKVTLGLDGWS